MPFETCCLADKSFLYKLEVFIRPLPNFLDQIGLIFINAIKQTIKTKTKLHATADQNPPNFGILTKLSAANAEYSPTTDQYILLKWVSMSLGVLTFLNIGNIPVNNEIVETNEKKWNNPNFPNKR